MTTEPNDDDKQAEETTRPAFDALIRDLKRDKRERNGPSLNEAHQWARDQSSTDRNRS